MKRPVPWLLGVVLAAGWTVALVRCVTARVSDADVWWVAAAGRGMLASGRVPRTNAFSFVEPDHPWVMHEWLFGVPYALGLEAIGPRFFALVAAAAFVAFAAVVLRGTLGTSRHAAVGILLAMIPLLVFAHPTARPTWVALLFPGAMTVLAFGAPFRPTRAVACVLLELAWTNAHGTFPLGVAILVAAAFAGPADRRLRSATAAGAALVTLVNPYGVRLHALVASYAFGGAELDDLRRIAEYAPLGDPRYLALVTPLGALALLFLAAAAVTSLVRRRHRARSVLVLAMLPFAAQHARTAPLVGVVASLVLVPVLDDLVPAPRLAEYAGSRAPLPTGLLAAGVGFALAVAGASFAAVSSRPAPDRIDPALGGASFVRLAARVPDGGRAMAPFRSSGLLVWLAAGRGVGVFYDPRNDSYSSAMRHAALTLPELPPSRIAAELEARGTEWAIVPSPEGLPPDRRAGYDGALAGSANWSVAARDGGWCLYGRQRSTR
ncbi:MAG TPA: hypothetical protein VGG39_13140 [Polyangiaceae bacterium]